MVSVNSGDVGALMRAVDNFHRPGRVTEVTETHVTIVVERKFAGDFAKALRNEELKFRSESYNGFKQGNKEEG